MQEVQEIKRKALQLYLEGMGFRAIARILGFSNVAILYWIREFAKQLKNIKSNIQTKMVEIDELVTYIKSKKSIVGYGLLLIDIQENSSILCLDHDVVIQEKSYGTK
jgi:hypothetical protein